MTGTETLPRVERTGPNSWVSLDPDPVELRRVRIAQGPVYHMGRALRVMPPGTFECRTSSAAGRVRVGHAGEKGARMALAKWLEWRELLREFHDAMDAGDPEPIDRARERMAEWERGEEGWGDNSRGE